MRSIRAQDGENAFLEIARGLEARRWPCDSPTGHHETKARYAFVYGDFHHPSNGAVRVSLQGLGGAKGRRARGSSCCGYRTSKAPEPAGPGSARRPVPDPIARPGAAGRRAIARIGQPAASSDRHPQPMHSVRPAFRRSSSAMRSSMRRSSRSTGATSPYVGARSGELGQLPADLLEREAQRWAKTMNAMRRSTGAEAAVARPARSERISPRSS